MDLHRVATMVGYINKSISIVSVMEFIHHAELDFNKLELNKHESNLKAELITLKKELGDSLKDPHKRLRFAEKILTIRCRL